jgi:hypothetical protein
MLARWISRGNKGCRAYDATVSVGGSRAGGVVRVFFFFLWGETMTTLAMMSSAIKWFRESARPLIFLTIITGTVVTIDVFGQFEAAAKAGKQYRTARRARLKTH